MSVPGCEFSWLVLALRIRMKSDSAKSSSVDHLPTEPPTHNAPDTTSITESPIMSHSVDGDERNHLHAHQSVLPILYLYRRENFKSPGLVYLGQPKGDGVGVGEKGLSQWRAESDGDAGRGRLFCSF